MDGIDDAHSSNLVLRAQLGVCFAMFVSLRRALRLRSCSLPLRQTWDIRRLSLRRRFVPHYLGVINCFLLQFYFPGSILSLCLLLSMFLSQHLAPIMVAYFVLFSYIGRCHRSILWHCSLVRSIKMIRYVLF